MKLLLSETGDYPESCKAFEHGFFYIMGTTVLSFISQSVKTELGGVTTYTYRDYQLGWSNDDPTYKLYKFR